MSGEPDGVTIRLTLPEALVLFELLSRLNDSGSDKPPIASLLEDQAEQRVLWDLEATLEKTLVAPFATDYADQLRNARDIVRDKPI